MKNRTWFVLYFVPIFVALNRLGLEVWGTVIFRYIKDATVAQIDLTIEMDVQCSVLLSGVIALLSLCQRSLHRI